MSGTGRPIDPDTVNEEDLPDNWVEKKSEALKDVLHEMTVVYSDDDEPVDIEFAPQSYAAADGSHIAINPKFWQEVDPPVSGPNILRVLDELNSHEMGHYNWSDLEGKQDFGEMYPGWGQIPGHISNILEDEYVDAKKMREFYGLRSKRAYRVKLTLDTDEFTPDVSEVARENGLPNALMAALHQTALCGAVRGIADAPDEVKQFCVLSEPVIERVRRQDDKHERFKLFHVVMQLFQRFVDEPDDFDPDDFEDGPGKAVSGDPDDAPDPEDVDPDDAMPDSFEEMIEEMMEEMMEEGEFPIDPDDMDADSGAEDGSITVGIEESDAGDEDGDDDASVSGAGEEPDIVLEPSEDDSDEDVSDGSDDDGESEDLSDDTDSSDESASGSDDSEDGADDGGDSHGSPDVDKVEDVEKPDEMDMDAPPAEFDIDGGEALHHIDDETMEEFAERDVREEVEDRYDVNLDEVDKVDERDRAKWARLVRELNDYDLDIEVRKRERDNRIEDRRKKRSDRRLHESLRARAEREGVIRELEDGFRELVSRNVPKPSRRGTRIDPINVSRRAAGDHTMTELFEEEQMIETGDRCVGLACDISGSMGGAIDDLKIAGGAIAKATEIIGDSFVWEAFTDIPAYHGSTDALDLRIVTGPNEEFDWEHTDSFGSAANEPTAAGIRDCFNLMQQTDANQYVMVVITDGMALITEDGRRPRGNEPVEQARQAVNEVRAQGVDVIGLGIGGMDERKMEETFGGKNYRLTSIDRLADDILELYKDQMNTAALKR